MAGVRATLFPGAHRGRASRRRSGIGNTCSCGERLYMAVARSSGGCRTIAGDSAVVACRVRSENQRRRREIMKCGMPSSISAGLGGILHAAWRAALMSPQAMHLSAPAWRQQRSRDDELAMARSEAAISEAKRVMARPVGATEEVMRREVATGKSVFGMKLAAGQIEGARTCAMVLPANVQRCHGGIKVEKWSMPK